MIKKRMKYKLTGKVGSNVSKCFEMRKGLQKVPCIALTLFKIYINVALKMCNSKLFFYSLIFADDYLFLLLPMKKTSNTPSESNKIFIRTHNGHVNNVNKAEYLTMSQGRYYLRRQKSEEII